jgi:ABC-type glycerol-3-phosphate transport system substrate-binding protein
VKKTIKIIAIIMMFCMLLPTVVACKENMGTTDSNSSDVVQTNSPDDTDKWGQQMIDHGIPDSLDYGDKAVTMLIREKNEYKREWMSETVGDSFSSAIYARNVAVEEYLGVTLKFIVKPHVAADPSFNLLIENVGMSGEGEFDIVSNYAAYATQATVLPYYVNFYDDMLTYIDLDKPYWNQEYKKAATAYDRMYVAVGDANLSVYDRMVVTFFNKELVENLCKDTLPDIYQTVLDGKWTYEVFYNTIKDIHDDKGTYEDTSDDIWGVTSVRGYEAADAFLYPMGGEIIETNADGSHSLVSESKLTKLGDIFSKMETFWKAPGASALNPSEYDEDAFSSGHLVFSLDVLYRNAGVFSKIVDMADGFGVVPCPKYDESQDRYYAGVQGAHNVMSIMYLGNQDYEMISAVMELLNAESYKEVRPYYIETMIQTRYLDFKSSACMELVLDGAKWDFSTVYYSLTDAKSLIWASPMMHNKSFEVAHRENLTSLTTQLKKSDIWLRENG